MCKLLKNPINNNNFKIIKRKIYLSTQLNPQWVRYLLSNKQPFNKQQYLMKMQASTVPPKQQFTTNILQEGFNLNNKIFNNFNSHKNNVIHQCISSNIWKVRMQAYLSAI